MTSTTKQTERTGRERRRFIVRKHVLAAYALVALAATPPTARAQRTPFAEPVDARVEALLRQMTLEEKIGEMTQITIGAVLRQTGTATRPQLLDSAKLETSSSLATSVHS